MREGRFRAQFARVWIALVSLAARADDEKLVLVPLAGFGNKPRPIAVCIAQHELIGRLIPKRCSAEGSVEVDRARAGRPHTKRGAIRK